MVHMAVRDDDAQKARVRLPEARKVREQPFLRLVRRIERQADIEREAPARSLDLDACAADLLRAPVDAEPHRPSPLRLRARAAGPCVRSVSAIKSSISGSSRSISSIESFSVMSSGTFGEVATQRSTSSSYR